MAVNCVGVRAMPGAVPYKALKVSHRCSLAVLILPERSLLFSSF
jgi:hypothetical protein